jgi:hypothetical protein
LATRGQRFAIFLTTLLLAFIPGAFALQETNVRELVRQADFVGFVLAHPSVSDPTGEWRQFAAVTFLDSVKSSRQPDPTMTNHWMAADHFPPSQYPTWIPETGEYLVFLKQDRRNGREIWATLAALRVNYTPNTAGQIVGTIAADGQPEISKDEVRVTLGRVSADARSLNKILQEAAAAAARQDRSVSHDQRLAEARLLAAAIKPGTTRADVQKVFPLQDGGLMSTTTRYYLGSEVMVEVPFDSTGGFWKPENRVNGLIKVYGDVFHID